MTPIAQSKRLFSNPRPAKRNRCITVPAEHAYRERSPPVPRTTRTDRFPAAALKLLLCTKPFPASLWETATSASLYVRIGNEPVLSGQTPSLDALRDFLQCTDTFACGFCEVWAFNEAIYVETELEYREPGGVLRQIPCSVIARTTHGLVHDLRIYLDPSPIPTYRRG